MFRIICIHLKQQIEQQHLCCVTDRQVQQHHYHCRRFCVNGNMKRQIDAFQWHSAPRYRKDIRYLAFEWTICKKSLSESKAPIFFFKLIDYGVPVIYIYRFTRFIDKHGIMEIHFFALCPSKMNERSKLRRIIWNLDFDFIIYHRLFCQSNVETDENTSHDRFNGKFIEFKMSGICSFVLANRIWNWNCYVRLSIYIFAAPNVRMDMKLSNFFRWFGLENCGKNRLYFPLFALEQIRIMRIRKQEEKIGCASRAREYFPHIANYT
jgi:hypothetical protein